MLPDDLIALAGRVIAAYRRSGRRIVTAESCTGGLISGCLTAVAGSSAVLERGYVTYSNQAKAEALGVTAAVLAGPGAVSAEAVAAMATGALERSPADVAIAVSGIAGPDGGTAEKPVGLVYLALARRDACETAVERQIYTGDRAAVRAATVRRALELLLQGGDFG